MGSQASNGLQRRISAQAGCLVAVMCSRALGKGRMRLLVLATVMDSCRMLLVRCRVVCEGKSREGVGELIAGNRERSNSQFSEMQGSGDVRGCVLPL